MLRDSIAKGETDRDLAARLGRDVGTVRHKKFYMRQMGRLAPPDGRDHKLRPGPIGAPTPLSSDGLTLVAIKATREAMRSILRFARTHAQLVLVGAP